MAWRLALNEDVDVSALEQFAAQTKNKLEYIRGTALVLRVKGRKGDEVADSLGVGRQAVYKWEKMLCQAWD